MIFAKIQNLKNMNVNIKFKTAADFRKSLETRLQAHAKKTGIDLQRLRRKVAFDRFLARIFSKKDSNFFLKGGYAMELRVVYARATKDIDLTFIKRARENEVLNALILEDLQNLAMADLNDHFSYQIGKAQIDLENAPYGGSRFPVSATIQGKIFVRFQVDVGGDFLLDKAEIIQGTDWLQFCDIPPPVIPMISIEQQLAEKLHTYTLPRHERINSRAKDLIDMALLLNLRTPHFSEMVDTLQKVFQKRNTHPLPKKLNSPPPQWDSQFIAMAIDCGLSEDMQTNFEKVSRFYDRIIYKELIDTQKQTL
jgi:hypothetical protein